MGVWKQIQACPAETVKDSPAIVELLAELKTTQAALLAEKDRLRDCIAVNKDAVKSVGSGRSTRSGNPKARALQRRVTDDEASFEKVKRQNDVHTKAISYLQYKLEFLEITDLLRKETTEPNKRERLRRLATLEGLLVAGEVYLTENEAFGDSDLSGAESDLEVTAAPPLGKKRKRVNVAPQQGRPENTIAAKPVQQQAKRAKVNDDKTAESQLASSKGAKGRKRPGPARGKNAVRTPNDANSSTAMELILTPSERESTPEKADDVGLPTAAGSVPTALSTKSAAPEQPEDAGSSSATELVPTGPNVEDALAEKPNDASFSTTTERDPMVDGVKNTAEERADKHLVVEEKPSSAPLAEVGEPSGARLPPIQLSENTTPGPGDGKESSGHDDDGGNEDQENAVKGPISDIPVPPVNLKSNVKLYDHDKWCHQDKETRCQKILRDYIDNPTPQVLKKLNSKLCTYLRGHARRVPLSGRISREVVIWILTTSNGSGEMHCIYHDYANKQKGLHHNDIAAEAARKCVVGELEMVDDDGNVRVVEPTREDKALAKAVVTGIPQKLSKTPLPGYCHCGCLIDVAVMSFSLWKTLHIVSVSTGNVEGWGEGMRMAPREREFCLEGIKKYAHLKPDDLFDYRKVIERGHTCYKEIGEVERINVQITRLQEAKSKLEKKVVRSRAPREYEEISDDD